jgi:hypothetical protein
MAKATKKSATKSSKGKSSIAKMNKGMSGTKKAYLKSATTKQDKKYNTSQM